jgi:hypothetical protein
VKNLKIGLIQMFCEKAAIAENLAQTARYIADYDPRSLWAFQKVGYAIDAEIEQRPGKKSRCEYDVAIAREKWHSRG